MIDKMYVVVVDFDEGGVYGDGTETTTPVAAFTNESEAEAYVSKYSNKQAYTHYRVVSIPLNPDKEVK